MSKEKDNLYKSIFLSLLPTLIISSFIAFGGYFGGYLSEPGLAYYMMNPEGGKKPNVLVIVRNDGTKSVFIQRGKEGTYTPLKEATEQDIKPYFKDKFRTYRPPLDSVIEREVDPHYKGLDSIENKL